MQAFSEISYYRPLANILLLALNADYAVFNIELKSLSQIAKRRVEVDIIIYDHKAQSLIAVEVKRRVDDVFEGLAKAIFNMLYADYSYLALCEDARRLIDVISQYIAPKVNVGILDIENLVSLNDALDIYMRQREEDEKRALDYIKWFFRTRLVRHEAVRNNRIYRVKEDIVDELSTRYQILKDKYQILEAGEL